MVMKATAKNLAHVFNMMLNDFGKDSNFSRLARAVRRQIGDLEELRNVRSASDGYTGFIYYGETCKFYCKHRKVITSCLAEDSVEFGHDSLCGLVMSFNCLKDRVTEEEVCKTLYGNKRLHDEYVANALAWSALETVAFRFSDYCAENIED